MIEQNDISKTLYDFHMPPYVDPLVLHRENIPRLPTDAVLVPAYPGAGHAYLGNVLIELGLNYVDPYTEHIYPTGYSKAFEVRRDYRSRLTGMFKKDKGEIKSVPALTFVKTHLYPIEFHSQIHPIILLVRDPRDTIYSYYQWRLAFSEEGETGSFSKFLARPGVNDTPPIQDWIDFHEKWLEKMSAAPTAAVAKFEDLKRNGPKVMRPLLGTLGVHKPISTLSEAFDASSFEKMRLHEDTIALKGGNGRIMRRGITGEWQEWFDGSIRKRFETKALRQISARFGYTVDAS